MKRVILLVFSMVSIYLTQLAAREPYKQRIYGSQLTWQNPVLLDTCANVDFYYSLSKMPGIDGKQHAKIIVQNRNSFMIRAQFKVHFVSAEDDTYDSAEAQTLLKGNFKSDPVPNGFVPFGPEDLNRTDYPEIYQMGMFDLQIRNWDLPDNGAGYTRGTLISNGCNPSMKIVGVKKPKPNATRPSANQPFPIGCWKFTRVDSDENLITEAKLFKPDGTVTFWKLTNDRGQQVKPEPDTYKWELRGNEIVITSPYNGVEEQLRSDSAGRLRGWYYNDKGDTPSNIRYYGVKDPNACSGVTP